MEFMDYVPKLIMAQSCTNNLFLRAMGNNRKSLLEVTPKKNSRSTEIFISIKEVT